MAYSSSLGLLVYFALSVILPPTPHTLTHTDSRQAGQRVGGYLSTIIPLIMHFVQLDEENGDDELRESCLQAFEAFVLRCFREISPHIQGVSERASAAQQSIYLLHVPATSSGIIKAFQRWSGPPLVLMIGYLGNLILWVRLLFHMLCI